ncbi:MAG: glycosyltransferase, partial [Anaerolineae bacterium]
MRASVIVPAHNAAKTIEECLEALHRQSLPGGDYEVIVVDDGSSDSTREKVAEYGAKLLTQDHQGPAVARNLGVAQAQGEIVLFTDADCVPTSDWIETMLTPFRDDQIVGTKGIYRTHQKELVARFVQLEYEDKYDLMRKERYIDFVDTYSAAYRKEVFNNNEGFDPAFPRASGEDTEFSYRLAERGHK